MNAKKQTVDQIKGKKKKIFKENGGSSAVECIQNQSFAVYDFATQFSLNRWIICLLFI